LAIHGSSPLRKVGVGYWEHFSSSVAAPIATAADCTQERPAIELEHFCSPLRLASVTLKPSKLIS
jgi:hypothetical protein